MKEAAYVGIGLITGWSLLAFTRSKVIETLQRQLAAARTSREYWKGLAEQYEAVYDLERGIYEIGKQVDAAAKEMGL